MHTSEGMWECWTLKTPQYTYLLGSLYFTLYVLVVFYTWDRGYSALTLVLSVVLRTCSFKIETLEHCG